MPLTFSQCMAQYESDAEQHHDYRKVSGRVRRSVNMTASKWVSQRGKDFASKDEALQAFKEECFPTLTGRPYAACCGDGVDPSEIEVHIVGIGILVMILVSLMIFFFERWWSRSHPNT